MLKKRLFQVLDEMNVNDDQNKTATLACCFDMVEAKTAKGGAHVIMGVPTEALHKLMHNEYKAMLVLLDMKEYHRLEAIPMEDKLQAAEEKAEKAQHLVGATIEKVIDLMEFVAEAKGHVSDEEIISQVRKSLPELLEALTPKTSEDDKAG